MTGRRTLLLIALFLAMLAMLRVFVGTELLAHQREERFVNAPLRMP